MKSNRLFWFMLVGSVLLLVVGYVGFISMPDKTSGYLVPILVLCLVMIGAGAIGLVGALVCAVVRAAKGGNDEKTTTIMTDGGATPEGGA